MKKRFKLLVIFLLFIGTIFILPNRTVHANGTLPIGAQLINIEGVQSAYKFGGDLGFNTNKDYQENNHNPITLTTDYPCLDLFFVNGASAYIKVDGKDFGSYYGLYNRDPYNPNIYVDSAYYVSQGCCSVKLVLRNLTPGKHTIQLECMKSHVIDYITVILP